MKFMLFLAILPIPFLPLNFKKEAKLQSYDVMAIPGEEILLRAKLEKKGVLGINPDLNGKEIIFSVGEQEIGRAKTSEDGTAELKWTPAKDEQSPYRVIEVQLSLQEESKYHSADRSLSVFLFDPKKPTLAIDLDGTICTSSEIEVGTKDPSELKAMEGSVDALKELAKQYAIVYLTARDDALINRSREWLELNRYPRAPLLVRDLKLWNLSAKSHKTQMLKNLKKSFNLVAGVGDRNEDAEAYLAAGMESYMIGDETKVPLGSRKLKHWSEIATLLKKP